MIKKLMTLTAILLSAASGSMAKTIKVEVSNPSRFERAAVPVVIDLSQYGVVQSAKVLCSPPASVSSAIPVAPLPYQLDDLDGDGYNDELCFMTSLSAKETKTFTVELNDYEAATSFPSLVYVEMLLSNKKIKEENKQNIYISNLTVDRGVNPYNQLHHHGAAFENALVAYRIYFDHRQTVDIYGKYHQGLELRETQFYPDDEQKRSGYGDDILWVGNTFGLGTLRGFDGEKPTMINDVVHRSQRIVSRGPIRTIVEVADEGWLPNAELPTSQTIEPSRVSSEGRITMTTRYTLYADRRDCQVDVMLSEQPASRFSTGIINVKNSEEYSDRHGLRGCWGTDWPVSEKDSVGHKRETVGLGICLPQQSVVSEWPADQDNYGFEIKIPKNHLTYFISFCSDNEDFGYHSSKEWFDYLRQWKQERSTPPTVRITSLEP
ncbi:MAG: DUF4861 domain-containing protein [Prevotella sp.]|nr:DUF4861 domain-containing protein [Prevotella sp.]